MRIVYIVVYFCLVFTFSDSICYRKYVPTYEKRNRTVTFLQCVGCMQQRRAKQARKDLKECVSKTPEAFKTVQDDCQAKVASAYMKQYWKQMCNNREKAGKMYDCVMDKVNKKYKNFTDKEKSLLVEYQVCREKVNYVYCTKIHPKRNPA